jgi:hypothetical protein
MAPSKITVVSGKLNYGDTVRLVSNPPMRKFDFTQGYVSGMRIIDSEEIAQRYGLPIGSSLVIVEDEAGNAEEIPESFLERLT